MLKNNKEGFSMAEALVALLVLTIGIRYFIPILVETQFEIKQLQHRQMAIQVVHNLLLDWAYNGTPPPTEVIQDSIHYLVTEDPLLDKKKVCLSWYVTKERKGQECEEVKQ